MKLNVGDSMWVILGVSYENYWVLVAVAAIIGRSNEGLWLALVTTVIGEVYNIQYSVQQWQME